MRSSFASTYTFLHPFRAGQEVFAKRDPRHVGRVEYAEGTSVRVVWENGWKTDFDKPNEQLEHNDPPLPSWDRWNR